MTDRQAMVVSTAVDALESDIRNRRGLRQEFEQIDDDIVDEIRGVWAGIIVKAIAASDAQYVPKMVKALNFIHDISPITAQRKYIEKILSELPEDLR